MSFQVRDQCYATALSAAHAYASEQPVTFFASDGQQVACRVVASGSAEAPELLRSCRYLTGPAVGADVPALSGSVPYVAAPCGLIDVADAQVIAWGIAGVWIVCWGVAKYLRRVVT